MSLNHKDDIIAKFKKSNQGYLDNLNPGARQALEELIDLCYPYLGAIVAKGEPFEDESVEITMMIVQQLIIKALKAEDSQAVILKDALLNVVKRIDNMDGELQLIRTIITEAISKKKPAEPHTSEYHQSKLDVK